jgi:cardiolipin synthase A/B
MPDRTVEQNGLRLLQQPDDGVMPLVKAIDSARHNIEILIFRFDQRDIERALASAVNRGVAVRALIAHLNGSGEEKLRGLEMRLLAAGVTVARTADDFKRYHAKLMIVDRRELYVLAFNLTHNDINRSRSFGIITRHQPLVQEALKLFEADVKRQHYEPGLSSFVVSPANARAELASLIKGAKSELLIYDPKISDPPMLRLLQERSRAGVDIKVIGQVSEKGTSLASRKLSPVRLHARMIIRDRQQAFIGSQSLREMELDSRREVGVVFEDASIVERVVKTFLEDWSLSEQTPSAAKVARKVARAVTKDLPAIAPMLEGTSTLDAENVEDVVREAVRDAVREAVLDAVQEASAKG